MQRFKRATTAPFGLSVSRLMASSMVPVAKTVLSSCGRRAGNHTVFGGDRESSCVEQENPILSSLPRVSQSIALYSPGSWGLVGWICPRLGVPLSAFLSAEHPSCIGWLCLSAATLYLIRYLGPRHAPAPHSQRRQSTASQIFISQM